MLLTGIILIVVGILLRAYASVFEIHDSTLKAMGAVLLHKIAAIVGAICIGIGLLCLLSIGVQR